MSYRTLEGRDSGLSWFKVTLEDQICVLVEALHTHHGAFLEGCYLPPQIRERLDRFGPATRSAEPPSPKGP